MLTSQLAAIFGDKAGGTLGTTRVLTGGSNKLYGNVSLGLVGQPRRAATLLADDHVHLTGRPPPGGRGSRPYQPRAQYGRLQTRDAGPPEGPWNESSEPG